MSTRAVVVEGVPLGVAESGRGEPLVLVHGSWDDRSVWSGIEADLARRFRVVSYDRRGHTGSGEGPGTGTRRDDEDDLAALIELLGLAPAHVVGSSFGGSVALGLAGRRPELFRTLCVHEPPLLSLVADDPLVTEVGEAVGEVLRLIEGGQVEAAARAFAELTLGPGEWEAMVEGERARMVRNARPFLGEQRDPAWAGVDLAALGGLPCPVLVTQGDQGPAFFATIVARIVEAVPDAEVRTLTGAGHEPHLTHPDEYAAVLRRFAGR